MLDRQIHCKWSKMIKTGGKIRIIYPTNTCMHLVLLCRLHNNTVIFGTVLRKSFVALLEMWFYWQSHKYLLIFEYVYIYLFYVSLERTEFWIIHSLLVKPPPLLPKCQRQAQGFSYTTSIEINWICMASIHAVLLKILWLLVYKM